MTGGAIVRVRRGVWFLLIAAPAAVPLAASASVAVGQPAAPRFAESFEVTAWSLRRDASRATI